MFQEPKVKNNTDIDKNESLTLFIYLKQYLRPYKKEIFLAFFSIIIAFSAVLSSGYALRLFVEEGTQKYPFYTTPLWSMALSILFLAVGSFGRSFYVAWLGERITTDMRQSLFKKIIYFDVHFFETTKASEIVTNLTTDLNFVQTFIGNSVAIFIRNIGMCVGALGLMIYSSPWLFMQTFIGIFIMIIPMRYMGKKVKDLQKKSTTYTDNIVKITDEVFNAIRTVQAFVQESFFINTFDKANANAFNIQKKRLLLKSTLSMMVIIFISLFIGTIIYLGLKQVEQGMITQGHLVSFLYYTILVASTMSSFPELIMDSQKASLALERLSKLEQLEPLIHDPKSPKKIQKQMRGIVAIHNVSFAYPSNPQQRTINQLTLSLFPGERLAIVGPSGAGKSTLFSLLLRFYDRQSGIIYLDGTDIKELPLKLLRESIALVPQEPDIFSMSIYDNILYGNPHATEEEIQYAINALQLDEIFQKLQNGPHTIVGNKGVRLSGGQKQRIVIARALLKKPKLLLLDEATSHLDSLSEELIQKCLTQMMKTCTTIIIAHRLSTVLSCDRIAVFNHGILEELGTHAELVGNNGLYKQLASLQFQHADRLNAQQ